VTRAGRVGRNDSHRDLEGPDKAQLMAGVIQIANTTYNQLVGNQQCLTKNPNVLNTATSVISAVGATAAVINPALGLGLSAGATFLGETIEGIRQLGNARDIRRIADNSVAFEAYKCALETMSERWCQMKDAEAFLIFKANQRRNPSLNSDLGIAIRLNDRDIPVLLEWLNKIRSGVTPTTTSDASRQSIVFQREALIRSLEASGIGLIEENREIYSTYSDLEERWTFLRSLILNLIPPNNTPVKNPFYDVLTRGYSPYFLLGLPDDGSIRNELGYIDFSTWQKPSGFNPTLDMVKERYIEWINKSRVRVNQELTQVLQPDALQTLSSAYDRLGNRWKMSPMDSMLHLIEFLEKNPPRQNDYAFNRLYSSSLAKLKDIYNITQDAVINASKETPSAVQEIYEIAQLKYGTVVLESRLDMIVRLSLLELLETSSPEDQVVVAQLLAAERFTETITNLSGTDNLAIIRADIKRAQPITISNINSFVDIFGKNINKILKRLYKEEYRSSGTIAAAKRYARTEMCLLLLSVPSATKYVDIQYCIGLGFDPVVQGGPSTPKITWEIFDKDLNDRACTYREYFRQSKIYENWGIK
jgi:hypothetical protein